MLIHAYEADSSIADYTDLSGVTLTGIDTSESVDLGTDTTYKAVSGGTTEEITMDDLQAGDMVAVTTDSSGGQEVIVLEYSSSTDTGSTDSSSSSTSSVADSAESSALEEASGE